MLYVKGEKHILQVTAGHIAASNSRSRSQSAAQHSACHAICAWYTHPISRAMSGLSDGKMMLYDSSPPT